MNQPVPETADAERGNGEAAPEQRPIARPGETCWRLAPAPRAAFLIDGESYFRALRSALIKAERSIIIIGWEFHSRVLLEPAKSIEGNLEDGWPNQIHDLLQALARRRKNLEVRILLWDFAMLYLLEREILPLFQVPWRSTRRIRFQMDSRHPAGASHHQKIVVIDDKVAFAGGLDLTSSRWDTPAHAASDPRRVTPSGSPYKPFHDVQMVVDGEAAACLGELARIRWRRATGRSPQIQGSDSDPWPDDLTPDVRNAPIAIARTEPKFDGREEVREVEHLYLESIAAARHSIYAENQYFTSSRIGDAILESLQRETGPEIVFIGPRTCSGWLEETTMGVGRARLLRRLREADRYGRFAAYCPVVPGLPADQCLAVHSKVMVVDDRLVRIGSSNLANRSMGLDTECDLAVESAGREDLSPAVAGFRNRLLAEHLGCGPEEVAQALALEGSMIRAIEGLRGGPRSLEPIDDTLSDLLDQVAPDTKLVDPEEPISSETLAAYMLDQNNHSDKKEAAARDGNSNGGLRSTSRRAWLLGALLLVIAGLAGAWHLTPLAEMASVDEIMDWMESWRDNAAAPFIVLAGFLLGGLIVFPVVVLISAVGILFGPVWGFVYGMTGTLLSAALLFWLGNWGGRDSVRRLGGRYVNRVSQQLGRHGLKAIVVLRVLPVAPFSIVNLVAGASHISFRDFILGTFLGMAPGVLALVLFGGGLLNLFKDPDPTAIAMVVGSIILLLGVGYAARGWITRDSPTKGQAEDRTS